MKILILSPTLTGGGAERIAQNLAVGLTRIGAQIKLLTLQPEPARVEAENMAAKDLASKGVEVQRLEAGKIRRAFPELVKMLRRERPSALISHLEYLNVPAILCRYLAHAATRVVVVNHIQLSVEARHSPSLRTRLLPWLARLTYPRAYQVVCVSRGSADDLAQMTGLSRSRIQVIYNPVIGPGFLSRLSAPVTHSWFTDELCPIFISAGRMVPQKDFANLITAFAQVRGVRAARLAIFGDGPLRGSLQSQVRELGIEPDVCFMGQVENLPAYMKRARAFVLSSQWEALPTVLIEAMAAGCRVISTDCPSGPREILAGGQYGTLVPTGSAPALARAMLAELERTSIDPMPSVSWQPFLEQTACQQYLKLCAPVSS